MATHGRVSCSVSSELLRSLAFQAPTDLRRIEPHRLRELVCVDLQRHGESVFREIHARIGQEIPAHQVRAVLRELAQQGAIERKGTTRDRRYRYLKK